MHWYAETPARRSRQIVGDLLVLAWVVLWVLVGRWVFGVVRTLAAPADPLRSAGTGLREKMTEIAGAVVDVPLVGDTLDDPFRSAGSIGDDLVSAGNGLDEGVTRIAWLLSLLTAGTPILVVAGAYLLARLAFARRAGALAAQRDTPQSLELLALRALVHQSPRRLAAVGPDPLGAWRARDVSAITRLADLELRRVGLRARPGSSTA